eukprot:tig00021580_g22593.t1
MLNQGAGYGTVLGMGVFFSGVISVINGAEKKYMQERMSSEAFHTAGRSVRTGLLASSIVSSWTWAATLLQSSSVAYQYGVSGPFWYAAGASIQIVLFSICAIALKRRAPNAHTFLEVIHARYGPGTHIVLLVFALACNVIVTAMLLLGGASVASLLTGMETKTAVFLIPIGVIMYTLTGGLGAALVSDYIHTGVLYVSVWVFMFVVYTSSPLLGSPGAMYDALKEAARRVPVAGNVNGEYLTLASSDGLMFGLINIVGNFGSVFVDQTYWQRAVAARSSASVWGFIIGGIAWFAVPFCMATSLGLAARALEPQLLLDARELDGSILHAEVSAGLVAPYAVHALMGQGGDILLLLAVFMAVTSTCCAEMIAVAAIVAYDIYRAYIKPEASGQEILNVSHMTVVVFGVFMGVASVGLQAAGISLGYLYLAMGVLIGAAVPPVALTVLSERQTAQGAVAGCVGGTIAALLAWLASAYAEFGTVTLDSTAANRPMLFGNLTAILSSWLISEGVSYAARCGGGGGGGGGGLASRGGEEWLAMKSIALLDPIAQSDEDEGAEARANRKEREAARLQHVAKWAAAATSLVLVIVIPFPLHVSQYVFSRGFFTAWIAVFLGWGLATGTFVLLLPVWEARRTLRTVLAGLHADGARAVRFLRPSHWALGPSMHGPAGGGGLLASGSSSRYEAAEIGALAKASSTSSARRAAAEEGDLVASGCPGGSRRGSVGSVAAAAPRGTAAAPPELLAARAVAAGGTGRGPAPASPPPRRLSNSSRIAPRSFRSLCPRPPPAPTGRPPSPPLEPQPRLRQLGARRRRHAPRRADLAPARPPAVPRPCARAAPVPQTPPLAGLAAAAPPTTTRLWSMGLEGENEEGRSLRRVAPRLSEEGRGASMRRGVHAALPPLETSTRPEMH